MSTMSEALRSEEIRTGRRYGVEWFTSFTGARQISKERKCYVDGE
jgi:hypothetical protein